MTPSESWLQRDPSHAYPTATGIWPPLVASGCIGREGPGVRHPLSWCFVWWQVQGSNLGRRSQRFYSPILLSEAYAANLWLCVPRRDLGRPPSAMRPWAPGFGVRAVHGRAGTSLRTGAERPRTGPVGAVMPTFRLDSGLGQVTLRPLIGGFPASSPMLPDESLVPKGTQTPANGVGGQLGLSGEFRGRARRARQEVVYQLVAA